LRGVGKPPIFVVAKQAGGKTGNQFSRPLILKKVKNHPYNTILFSETLPFTPCERQVIYIEDEYNSELNALLSGHCEKLQEKLSPYEGDICYFPALSKTLGDNNHVRYFTPYQDRPVQATVDSRCLNAYAKKGERISPAFVIYTGETERGFYRFARFPLESAGKDFFTQFEKVVEMLRDQQEKQREESLHIRCCTTDLIEEADEFLAEDYFDEEVERLVEEVREKIEQLRQHGVSQMVLQQLLKPQIRLSRMHITAQGRIFLPAYNNLEIKMPPLVKAVYFLFLRHPEGIFFKCLPDYREELLETYRQLTGRQDVESVLQSIADVTDPCKNSINEKCARIREAFVREFEERLARYYFVTGSRGTAKRIILNRQYVTWEKA